MLDLFILYIYISFQIYYRETISTNGNLTTSVVSFVPTPEDNGSFLICKSENIRLPNSELEDKLLLDIFCK